MRKLTIVLILVLIMIAALLGYYAPTIISYFQNSASSDNSYTSLTLRDKMNNTATLVFGDTEYSFVYDYGAGLYLSTFIEVGKTYTPHAGDTYRDFGMEIKVSNVTSDYISNYIVFLVKPTIQNYMASLHYTEVNLTLDVPKSVNISSGLVNETHQYVFTYTKVGYPYYYSTTEPYLTIRNETLEKKYHAYASGSYAWSTNIKEFNIETTIFKIETQYMVIYVKPLY